MNRRGAEHERCGCEICSDEERIRCIGGRRQLRDLRKYLVLNSQWTVAMGADKDFEVSFEVEQSGNLFRFLSGNMRLVVVMTLGF